MIHKGNSSHAVCCMADLVFTHTDRKILWIACYKLPGRGMDSLMTPRADGESWKLSMLESQTWQSQQLKPLLSY